METSKALLENIRNNQNQMKITMLNHQLMVYKLRENPSDQQIKNNLADLQHNLITLSETQKNLLQMLRRENQDKCAVGKSSSSVLAKSALTCAQNNTYVRTRERPCMNRDASNNHGRPSSVTSSRTSEDSQDEDAPGRTETPPVDTNVKFKLEFMSAVGLVTRDVLSELQNRRVERKRRSTANHLQYVYGNNWDVSSKKKKSNYLTSNSTPSKELARHMTQAHASAPPNKVSAVDEKVSPVLLTKQETVSSSVADNTTTASAPSLSLRIPGLPSSLTIERVSSPQPTVDSTSQPGQMSSCSTHTKDSHEGGISDENKVKCSDLAGKEETSNSLTEASVTANMTILQNYIDDHKIHIQEREAEKQRLLEQNQQLNSEKEELEKRARELSGALAAQSTKQKSILQSEEMTRKSIKKLQEFIALMQTPRPSTSS